MEAFYQESGRAGRDQLPSRSLLYYGMDDQKRMVVHTTCRWLNIVRVPDAVESFGEQVSALLCKKSCDACKHPNLITNYLEELTTACAVCQRNGFSKILMSSSTDAIDNEQFSEFWNRDDEASGSEEDISDFDGINEKIEFLQRAEENYYHNKVPDKQANKPDKNAISGMLRDSSKQRLLDALKQVHQRLGDLKVDFDASSTFLENECFKKYRKRGKSFFYSQVASTVRWLSTTSSAEITNRIGIPTTPPSENVTCKEETPLTASTMFHWRKEDEEHCGNIESGTSVSPLPLQSASPGTKQPQIPSFSQFVNSRKSKRDSTKYIRRAFTQKT
ncbi:hypothetical protein REPUB_Repub09cG0203300 [Reevesia pubescens]